MKPEPDYRDRTTRERDEQLAAEPPKPGPGSVTEGSARPIEEFLGRADFPRPKAALGIVENGVVRPVDAELRLPERSKVLIVGEW